MKLKLDFVMALDDLSSFLAFKAMGYGEFSSPTIAMSVLILYAVDLLYRTSKEEKLQYYV